jgi:hypothetical protein
MNRKAGDIVIGRQLLKSKAYWTLSVHAIRTYTTFLTKRRVKKHRDSKGNDHWVITNNGKITFTYKEALMLGMSRMQFRDAIDSLIAKGFLEITHQGTGTGDPSTFKLTERWQAYGTENFEPAKQRRRNIAKNRGWALYNTRQKQKSSDKKNTSPSINNNTSSVEEEIFRVLKEILVMESRYACIS